MKELTVRLSLHSFKSGLASFQADESDLSID